jgi:hypothetical protein
MNLDKQNNILAIDTYKNRIETYSSSGVINVISEDLIQLQSIYVDSSTGDIYILNMNYNWIENIYSVQLCRQNFYIFRWVLYWIRSDSPIWEVIL